MSEIKYIEETGTYIYSYFNDKKRNNDMSEIKYIEETGTYMVRLIKDISISFNNFADDQHLVDYDYKVGNQIEIEVAYLDAEKKTVNIIVQDVQEQEGIGYDIPIDTFQLIAVQNTQTTWEAV